MNLNIQVRDRIAVFIGRDTVHPVGDNTGDVAVFDLDSEWSTYALKTARFTWQDNSDAFKTVYTDVPLTGSSCTVPQMSNTDEYQVCLYAGNLRTSTAARVPVLRSGRYGSAAPAAPTQSVYDQIIALINAGAVKGDTGDTGPQGPAGPSGTDGVSPAVSVSSITGGHRITITDATHTAENPLTFDVTDGEDVDLQEGAGIDITDNTVSLDLNTISAAGSDYVLNNNNDYFPLYNILSAQHKRMSFVNFVSNLWNKLKGSNTYSATYSNRGLVKADGRTVFVDGQGTLSTYALTPFEINIITGDTESAVKFSDLGDSRIRLNSSANGFISADTTPNTYFDSACIMAFEGGEEFYVTPDADNPLLASVAWKTGGTQPTGEILCNMRLNNDEKLEMYNFNASATHLIGSFFIIASITPVTVEEDD